jgi:hypothetical protein
VVCYGLGNTGYFLGELVLKLMAQGHAWRNSSVTALLQVLTQQFERAHITGSQSTHLKFFSGLLPLIFSRMMSGLVRWIKIHLDTHLSLPS